MMQPSFIIETVDIPESAWGESWFSGVTSRWCASNAAACSASLAFVPTRTRSRVTTS